MAERQTVPVCRSCVSGALGGIAALSWTAPALACPSCPTAAVVRDSVYDASFGWNLALILLPLIILAAMCRRLYQIGLEPLPEAAREGVET